MIFPIFEIATEFASSKDLAIPTAHKLLFEYSCSFFETHSGAFFFVNPEFVAHEKKEDIKIIEIIINEIFIFFITTKKLILYLFFLK